MRKVARSAIVPYSVEAMYDLVAAVEDYPRFLPWCSGAQVITEAEDEVLACLELSQGALKGRFTTRNRMVRPSLISMTLVEGPFSDLDGEWHFEPLGEQGSRIEFTISFAFSNPLKDMLLGSAFEQTCNKLVDAFVDRARVCYD